MTRVWRRAAVVLGALLALAPVRALAEVQRVVSLAPSVTETIFALGLGDRLVGVSLYCDFPPAAARIDRVGTFLMPNVEAIVAKRPDLVIAVPTPGNQNPVETLRRLGLTVLVVDPLTIRDLEEAIVTIGRALGVATRAEELVAAMERRLAGVRAAIAGVPPRRVLMVVGHAPLIGVGAGTMQDELIRMGGGVNLGAQAGGSWPRLSLEYVIAAAPDVIIDATMGDEAAGGVAGAMHFWGNFPTVPAVRDQRLCGQDVELLLRPGPRLPEALEAVVRCVHPDRLGRVGHGVNP